MFRLSHIRTLASARQDLASWTPWSTVTVIITTIIKMFGRARTQRLLPLDLLPEATMNGIDQEG